MPHQLRQPGDASAHRLGTAARRSWPYQVHSYLFCCSEQPAKAITQLGSPRNTRRFCRLLSFELRQPQLPQSRTPSTATTVPTLPSQEQALPSRCSAHMGLPATTSLVKEKCKQHHYKGFSSPPSPQKKFGPAVSWRITLHQGSATAERCSANTRPHQRGWPWPTVKEDADA